MSSHTQVKIAILIVEDSPTQAEQLRYLLDKKGYQITVAINGIQALDQISQHKPDLVISDITMPEMNGYELCQKIKAGESTNGIPVVLLTALTNPQDVMEGLACGADSFITKPYNNEYLLARIQRTLADWKLRTTESVHMGVEIQVAGKRRFIVADQQQMLGLLLSTYEAAIQRNNELIQVQEELSVLNEQLEIRVREKTASLLMEISERKLVKKAKEEADIANQAKSEFLSRMSHELRTPLNSILGFAQIMEMDEIKPEHGKNLKFILKAGYHLLDLINEVLDISHIDSGRLDLSPEPVELQRLILETLDTVTPMAKNRHVITELVDSPNNGLFVKADRQRLSQVLLNLINNAIKYNSEGGRVAISIKRKDRFTPGFSFSAKENILLSELPTNSVHKITAPLVTPQSVIRISITDTGPGIPSEQLPRLFNAFERGKAAQSGTEGTGLGLAVSKKLVDAMGGTINVETIPGTGSTFWVELLQTESPVNTADLLLTPEKIRLDMTKKGCVLYIEDNVSNLQLVEGILKFRPGVKLISERCGQLTMELALLHKPDLILLDLNLPDISGSEVITLLRTNPQTEGIPVVVLSADATSARIEALKSAGIQDYITKPLNIVKFLELIDRMIR